jgi:alpha-glucosidase
MKPDTHMTINSGRFPAELLPVKSHTTQTTHTVLGGLLLFLLLRSTVLIAQHHHDFTITSPDSAISVHVVSGAKLQWSVQLKGEQIIAPSAIALQLEGGRVLGDNATILSARTETEDTVIIAINYKKARIPDRYHQLTINCKDDYGLIFRVYNEGVAYRWFTKRKGEIVVQHEEANFNFSEDHKAFIPYMEDYRGKQLFNSSFEAQYREIHISQFARDSLAFLPLLVDACNDKKVVILEADLEDYPGMYLTLNQTRKGFMGVYAPYPLETQLGGYENMNVIPTKRAGYIARTGGTRTFPWRAIVISESDKELLNTDIVQKLASPSRIADISWIKPGQVAWDWWNNWNISHVDFKAGYNTPTYKYYIDFAAVNKIDYIIMDEGWSGRSDLTKVTPEISLQGIIDYGKRKGVGVILWATWYAVTQQMDTVFPLYSKMGVKGLKVDFIDRDDQKAVASTYEIARKAAEYHLIVDYHGVFKPTGLQRTYPNVLGYEGVRGLEYLKWAAEDARRYAVTIPFIRMMAGPMDYTPGAMRNATRANFKPVNSAPMSQGTRCQQLAMYVVYEAPLQMLSDNPTIYMREQECTDFITKIPTTFDETVALDGQVGEYVALARRKGNTWYAGAMGNGEARTVTLDLSFLGDGIYEAVVFKDGINADREPTDYKREVVRMSSSDKCEIRLSPAGGWAARIEKVQ